MKADVFIRILEQKNIRFFTGVPDSLLSPLINCIYAKYNSTEYHIPAVNEGASIGIAAGYYMATGMVPCVYMQNSGIGNSVNPIVSLLSDKVYKLPALLLVGWRGEPGVKDEPQHVFQGEITEELLKVIGVNHRVIDNETTESELEKILHEFAQEWERGKCCALVVRKDSFENSTPVKFDNSYSILREDAIRQIALLAPKNSAIVSTTGKISRELYEVRDELRSDHDKDFLTVGGMGHAISIAIGIATRKPNHKIICLDGDGAMLMHMGAAATAGAIKPKNLVHVVLDNGSHESVGAMPTSANQIESETIARVFGYPKAYVVDTIEDLVKILPEVYANDEMTFVRVKVNLVSRKNLGRPKSSAYENRVSFMEYLKR